MAVLGLQLMASAEDGQKARTRCYQVQWCLFETSTKILARVLERAWRERTGKAFQPQHGQFAAFLPENWEKRVGTGACRLTAGTADGLDITSFALILVDAPALLSWSSCSREISAVRDLRTLRNNFVHDVQQKAELSQEAFEALWATVIRHLTLLARWAGGDTEHFLKSETTKIQSLVIDKNKAQEFAALCSRLDGLEGRQSHVEEVAESCQRNVADLEKKHEYIMKRFTSLANKHQEALKRLQTQERELVEATLALNRQEGTPPGPRSDKRRDEPGQQGASAHVCANGGCRPPLRRGRSANRGGSNSDGGGEGSAWARGVHCAGCGAAPGAWARLEFGDGTHVPVCTAADAEFCVGGYRTSRPRQMPPRGGSVQPHYHQVCAYACSAASAPLARLLFAEQ